MSAKDEKLIYEKLRCCLSELLSVRGELYKELPALALVREIQLARANRETELLEKMGLEIYARYQGLLASAAGAIILKSGKRIPAEEALGYCLAIFWETILTYAQKAVSDAALTSLLEERLRCRGVDAVRKRCDIPVSDVTLALLQEEELRLSDPLRGSTSGADREILLESLLSELSAKQLEAVRECCLGGMTLEEFAAARGTKKAAASRLLARALKKCVRVRKIMRICLCHNHPRVGAHAAGGF